MSDFQCSPTTLNADQFTLLMSKLNEISNDIAVIKTTQLTLQSDLTECKSILEKHSSELLRLDKTLTRHSHSISQHDLDIASCSSRIDRLTDSQNSLKVVVDSASHRLSKVESLQQGILTNNRTTPSLQPSELLDRLRRSHNILIRGVPETGAEEDLSSVSSILDCVLPDANNQCVSVARIGKSSTDRPRILKVSFSNSVIVNKILRNKALIKSVPDYHRIIISDDKTPLQVKELDSLREELRRRRGAGESGIDIKYISGTPTITKTDHTARSKN
ncbi:uncharacterized protein LOC123319097 [Coccinella septempunctata]|uniref:uncharacterized protein LOC123319097 n=1 Tax=Coccinella septempunctata TaxID=41139 RepID=UPI001D06DA29|nr:uncharacterized protein LOC123319097 [Coccinella septempunctata]